MVNSITIIGKGALGLSLYKAFESLHYEINILGRGEWENGESWGDLLILCTDDYNVPKVVDEIVSKQHLKIQGRSVIHCSGTLKLDVLKPIQKQGGMIGAIHPIQTFVKSSVSDFENVFVSIVSENSHLIKVLTRIFTLLKAKPKKVSPEQKTVLHAAAVFSSNFVVGMLHASQRVLNMHDLDLDASEIFEPLYKKAVENIASKNLIDALSGPAKRGETQTIEKHVELLSKDQELANLYKSLTENLFHLIESKD